MFGEFFQFELRFRFRQPTVYLFSAVFFALAFGAMTTDAIVIGGGAGQTAIDSPYVITQMLAVMSVIAVLIVTAFVATSVTRDWDQGVYTLLFTKPIRRLGYLGGRFLGSLTIASTVMVACALGFAVGSRMPWLDPARLVSSGPGPYLHALGVFVVPNLLVMGALFFTVATLTRRVFYAYVAVVGFFVVYGVSQAYVSDLGNESIAALTDPFGLAAFEVATRYWTIAERNHQLVPLEGLLLANRALWLAAAAALFGLTFARFRFITPPQGGRGVTDEVEEASNREIAIPPVNLGRGRRLYLAQWAFQTGVEIRGILRSAPFVVLALFAVANIVGNAFGSIDAMFGTPVHPVTQLMLRVIEGGLSLFLVIVITFYAGELVWRERKVGMGEVYDALPLPEWVPLLAKLCALLVAVVAMLAVAMLTGIALQAARGYMDFELGLYLRGLFVVDLSRWALLCVLAIAVQVLTHNKYLGFLAMVLFFISQAVLSALDLDHHLYRYAGAPSAPYSDMNGFGHFVEPLVWYRLYWGFAAIILVLLANLFWPRGTDSAMRQRARAARRRVTRANTVMLAVAAAAFFSIGAWIYYNTNVLNRYVPGDEAERIAVLYEQRYKQYEGLPQPRIAGVEVEADLYPEERRLEIRGHYRLVNRSGGAIERLHVRIDPEVHIKSLSVPDDTIDHDDEELGYRIYRLDPPLEPGAEISFDFDLSWSEPGFKNHGSDTSIVYNGTFVHNAKVVPHFGYDPNLELSDANERRKRGLPERPRMASIDDEKARMNTYISSEADWIDFAATVSTSDDQVAIAPGYLRKTWEEDGRRWFRYEMDAPILNLWAIQSGRYAVARDVWPEGCTSETECVAIEIYHHAAHDRNVERMIYAVKKSLDYFTEHFSPYQHRQVRIIEFPRYASFAQSLPNTIPYSESIGFIADLTDPERIDYVYYVTAHEVAHQWWAHQVIGGNVQGGTMMSETFAQYSALMVMEQEYGAADMKRFLEYELDRYLQGRGMERERELPLYLVENQPYIHYRKGSLVMYALREYLGEKTVNGVLADYIRSVGFQEPPFTTSAEFLEHLRAATPPDHAYLIEDLFETITIYDNRAKSVQATELDDGRWQVDLVLESRKLRADEQGVEGEVDLDDWIEIGVFAGPKNDERTLYLEKHRLDQTRSELSVVVDERPTRAGIDPRILLVDRNPRDNVRSVD